MKKVMVVDGGARGHALAKAYLTADDKLEVIVAPGNEGIPYIANLSDFTRGRISIDPSVSLKNPNSILESAKRHQPDIIDVAQDDALEAGTVNLLYGLGFPVFGPTREAAQLEWDKAETRRFMERYGIPHPAFRVFKKGDMEAAKVAERFIGEYGSAFFKASGLYAGKGVVAARTSDEIGAALEAITRMGTASNTFLVEQGLRGEEFSWYVMLDGHGNNVSFNPVQDNKRLFDGDLGPNTGGMGANSPTLVTDGLESAIHDLVISPTIRGTRNEQRPYTGILYIGGMKCEDGSVKVIEFNSRWGDPECHVTLPAIDWTKGDSYLSLVWRTIQVSRFGSGLYDANLVQDSMRRVCLIAASEGYPDNPIKGRQIEIDKSVLEDGNVELLSAGIRVDRDRLYTNGGRVLSVVGKGYTTIQARDRALRAMNGIHFEGKRYRTDIAERDIQRELQP